MYIQMMIKVRNFHEKHQTYKTIHSINGLKLLSKMRLSAWGMGMTLIPIIWCDKDPLFKNHFASSLSLSVPGSTKLYKVQICFRIFSVQQKVQNKLKLLIILKVHRFQLCYPLWNPALVTVKLLNILYGITYGWVSRTG